MVLAKRHLVKTISYRLLGTTVTVLSAYALGMELKIASLIGVGELLIKPTLYYLHERFWYKYIKFGIKIETNEKADI
jgi:uncharacterized membrane protein